MKAVFGRGFYETNKKSDKYIYVNNCGYYYNIDNDINIKREKGRMDYQILYVSSGKLHVYEKIEKAYGAGTVIFFRPNEPQIYSVKKEDNTTFFWLHFSGTHSEEILRELGISKRTYNIAGFFEFEELCREAVHECSINPTNEVLISSILCRILALTGKKIHQSSNKFKYAVDLILSGEELSVEELADISGMSVYHFIREFKKEYGETPHVFITKYKIEKSKHFLAESDISIKHTAELSGFSDPLYFSRVFKKYTGVSPKKYRYDYIKN